MSYFLQATFSRGEIDPELADRPDLELYRAGLALCENFVTLKRGGVRRRGGTRYLGEVKNSAVGAWLLPFDFGNGQSYALEFGDYYFRVHTTSGRVGSVEVATPYSIAVVSELAITQSTDTLFVAGGGVRPQALKRLGETSWTIEPMQFKDGPFLPVNITATSLRPAGTGSPVPTMTSNTAPSGAVITAAATANDYKMFNPLDQGSFLVGEFATGWCLYQFPAPRVIDAYQLQAPNNNGTTDKMPSKWVLVGSNDAVNWTVLDSRSGETTWRSSEWRGYEFVNQTAYVYYRFNFSEGGGASGTGVAINSILFHERGENQSGMIVDASSTVGVNGGAGFVAEDVGRHIRILASDGRWRWLKITEVQTATRVLAQLYGQSIIPQEIGAERIASWRLGAWSERTGWPRKVGWHKSRLALAATTEEPQTIWESQTEDFTNFTVSQPLVASDAVTVGILSGQVNEIQWIADDASLVVGTSKAIRTIGKATENDPYGPDNVEQSPATNFGASNIPPVKIGSVLLYFGRFGTDLRELVYDIQSNGRVSQAISEVQSHMFLAGMKGACYQQYPSSIVWMWDANGKVYGLTYEREQEVFGMHSHDFGGVVECMISLPGHGVDEIWMIIRRTIGGQQKRYIEIMQAPFRALPIGQAWHLDSALRYQGAPVNTVSGLGHLEGKDVIMYADGSDYPAPVSGGAVSLPNERTAGTILIGLDVTARAKTLRPPVNAQDGASMGRKCKVNVTHVSVIETGTLRLGSASTYLDEVIRYRDGDAFGEPAPMRTGDLKAAVDLSWEDGGQLEFVASGGKPCTVRAINADVDLEP
jgi:hypothetical protein